MVTVSVAKDKVSARGGTWLEMCCQVAWGQDATGCERQQGGVEVQRVLGHLAQCGPQGTRQNVTVIVILAPLRL